MGPDESIPTYEPVDIYICFILSLRSTITGLIVVSICSYHDLRLGVLIIPVVVICTPLCMYSTEFLRSLSIFWISSLTVCTSVFVEYFSEIFLGFYSPFPILIVDTWKRPICKFSLALLLPPISFQPDPLFSCHSLMMKTWQEIQQKFNRKKPCGKVWTSPNPAKQSSTATPPDYPVTA